MFGQDGWVVYNRLVFGMRYHVHGDELTTEGQNVQIWIRRFVFLQHVRYGHALRTPTRIFEHANAIGLSRLR